MSDAPVLLDVSPAGVAVVTLNRPDKHNAFNAEVIAQLSDTFETLRANGDEVRIVFLRGNGSSFSAGAAAHRRTLDQGDGQLRQVVEPLEHGGERHRILFIVGLGVMRRRLHPVEIGAGLLAACDVGIVMKDAKIRFSEVRLGLTPATISPFVIRAIGPRWARALFASGEGFDGTFAHQIGLAQYVVENEDEMALMEEHLAKLAFSAAPGAVADAKKLVDDVTDQEINHGLAVHTAKAIARRRASDEGKEGLSAFLERRKPSWAE